MSNALNHLETSYDELITVIRAHTAQLEALEQKNKKFKELLESNHRAVVTLENSTEVYADAYKANHDNIQEIRQRIVRLEVATQIRPKTDLTY